MGSPTDRLRRAALAFALLLAVVFPLSALGQQSEVGSLRGFIFGHEPRAAYSNWYARTVEGLAMAGGYNDHIPDSLDQQNNGFGHFQFIPASAADYHRSRWQEVFSASWQGDLIAAQAILDSEAWPFDVVAFHDQESSQDLVLIRERLDLSYVDTLLVTGEPQPNQLTVGGFDYGWGLFVINQSAALPEVLVQAPHPNDDFASVPLAVEIFLRSSAGALALHATSREVRWTSGNYYNSKSLSDPTRNGNLPFQFFTEHFIERARQLGQRDLTLQLHSYDQASHMGERPIIISPGPADGQPNRPIWDRSGMGLDWINAMHHRVHAPDAVVPGLPLVTLTDYISAWWAPGLTHLASGSTIPAANDLPGYGGNHAMLSAMAEQHPAASHDRFLHVEFSEYPEAIEQAGLDTLAFYDGSRPMGLDNWERLLAFYRPATDGLVTALEEGYLGEDLAGPLGLDSVSAPYRSDLFVDLSWAPARDPGFDHYRIELQSVDSPEAPLVVHDHHDQFDLVAAPTDHARVGGLRPGDRYHARIIALDEAGNSSSVQTAAPFAAIDSSLPSFAFATRPASYPRGAWPPEFSAELISIEEPLSGELQIIDPYGPWTASYPMAVSPLTEGSWHLQHTAPGQPGPAPPGSELFYRYRVRDGLVDSHVVHSPASGWYPLSLQSGTHFVDEEFEADDGGLHTGGNGSNWSWGSPSEGPGGGYQSDRCWSLLSPENGTEATLTLDPGTLDLAGHSSVYLRMMYWVDSALDPYEAGRARAGGFLQISVAEGPWMPLTPVGGYPFHLIDSDNNEHPCFAGPLAEWQEAAFSLAPWLGQGPLRFRWVFLAPASAHLTLGWAVDNLLLTPFPPLPEQPISFRARHEADGGIQLSWLPVGSSFYRIYRSTEPFGPWTPVSELQGLLWHEAAPDVNDGPRYYQVRAVLD